MDPVGERKVDLLWSRAGAHDHRPAGLIGLPEVHPGLVQLERRHRGNRGHVLEQEHRLAIGLHHVGLVDHRAKPVGVEETGVLPIGGREVVLLQLAHRDHHLPGNALVEVSVGVDHAQRVIGLQLLEVLIGLGKHRRSPDPQVVDGETVGLDLIGGEIVGRLEGTHLYLVEPVGPLGRIEIVSDVRRLLRQLIREDVEPLDDRRVDGSGSNGHHYPRTHRDRGQGPPPPEDVENEESGGDEGDDEEQPQGGESGVDVGEPGAEELLGIVGEEQLVHVEPVGHRPCQRDQGEHHRQVDLGGSRGRDPPPVEPDPSIQVMGDRHDDRGQNQQVEQPIDCGLPQREPEHVEPDVEAEDGLRDPEVPAPHEQEDALPPGGHGEAEDHRQRSGHQNPDLPDPGLDPLPESLDELLLLGEVEGCPSRGELVDEPEARPQHEEGHADANRAQHQREAPVA